MLLPQHRRCILGDKEPELEAHSMVRRIPQTSNLERRLESIVTPEFVQSVLLFSKEVERLNSKKYSNALSIPKVHLPVQIFLQELVQFFSAVFRYYTFVRQYCPSHSILIIIPGVHVSLILIMTFYSASNCQDVIWNCANRKYRLQVKEYSPLFLLFLDT